MTDGAPVALKAVVGVREGMHLAPRRAQDPGRMPAAGQGQCSRRSEPEPEVVAAWHCPAPGASAPHQTLSTAKGRVGSPWTGPSELTPPIAGKPHATCLLLGRTEQDMRPRLWCSRRKHRASDSRDKSKLLTTPHGNRQCHETQRGRDPRIHRDRDKCTGAWPSGSVDRASARGL